MQSDDGLRSAEVRQRLEVARELAEEACRLDPSALGYTVVKVQCQRAVRCLDHHESNERATANAFWRHDGAHGYELRVDGETRATVDPVARSVDVAIDGGSLSHKYSVPDYVSVFEEAERQLALPRVNDVRDADGRPDPEARLHVEHTAALDRAARNPAQWVRAYAGRALALLTENKEPGPEASAAQRNLEAVAHGESRYARAPLEDARAHLEESRGKTTPESNALTFCDKAIATLDYEDAREVVATAHEEEALRREVVSPELAGSVWSQDSTGGATPAEPETARSEGGDSRRFQSSRGARASERTSERDRGGEDFGRER